MPLPVHRVDIELLPPDVHGLALREAAAPGGRREFGPLPLGFRGIPAPRLGAGAEDLTGPEHPVVGEEQRAEVPRGAARDDAVGPADAEHPAGDDEFAERLSGRTAQPGAGAREDVLRAHARSSSSGALTRDRRSPRSVIAIRGNSRTDSTPAPTSTAA